MVRFMVKAIEFMVDGQNVGRIDYVQTMLEALCFIQNESRMNDDDKREHIEKILLILEEHGISRDELSSRISDLITRRRYLLKTGGPVLPG